MIEIKAKLHGMVYLTGEKIQCLVTFTNPPIPENKTSQSNNDMFECLAWASAQIECLCTTSHAGIKRQNSNSIISRNQTSLALNSDNGQLEFTTKPQILFCDLRLSPGESKTYIYSETIPIDSPPSYRGQAVKYSYKITIGTQRVNKPVKLLRVPIKVLPLKINLNGTSAVGNDTTEELSPSNPFLDTKPMESPMEIALQEVQMITTRRTPNFYIISNTRGKVARFCLFKNAYRLGEDVVGTFDFTSATVNCVQLSVSLQSEETLVLNSSKGDGNREKEAMNKTHLTTHNKFHEVVLGLNYSHLILAIPSHVTPDFSTNLVSLKWRLHFEFVTSTTKSLQLPDDNKHDWLGPSELQVETMVWSLPIKLFPVTPIQISLALQLNDEYSLKMD